MASTKTEQWTKAPWQVVGFDPTSAILDRNEREIAVVSDGNFHFGGGMSHAFTDAEVQANADLLVSAPELYTALKNLVAEASPENINAAIAALAKARGGE